MAAKHQSLRSKNRRTEKSSKRERARKQNFKAKDKRNEKTGKTQVAKATEWTELSKLGSRNRTSAKIKAKSSGGWLESKQGIFVNRRLTEVTTARGVVEDRGQGRKVSEQGEREKEKR